ncbi:D-erythronate dehydrogenase [Aureimonas phyllosphaerae]|uniref:Nucleoside-diphosphate-sugar epimerase n=1 Tax=Aureimonas phyllosphaerae TaxID=1166078 RepID=A0A7W6BRM6_9HYPH|nr:D-erythronate dehydrogenase [Aureimonas phyllosphaerae]MBB3934734.1 nucleoside-diphosphate-sugar epimerase [Aureimonas phyllosphaerae]MBB3958051.1 nucleoside-diphosphate-sugar epimerase [Aureimonas phyllosphaerae]SFE91002.1 Nucleoside-diphosphate-sugar epimerase [Aureimonas phyllosphaerae]
MKVLIVGAAGMIGRKLAERIAADGGLGGQPVEQLVMVDVVEPKAPGGKIADIVCKAIDVSASGATEPLIAERPDVVFHLAAIVSGEAEADFEKGYRINLGGTRDLFDAIRHEHGRSGYKPRVVFASSIAVFGAPFDARVPEDFALTPLTSYGTQKAIGELLLADYTRRGFFDGVGLRLPTICVRPGAPNKAASGFFSNILREPMSGKEAVLPVADTVRHYFASPRAAVGFFLHAATMDTSAIGPRRNLNMPGLSATVGDELDALRTVAGDAALSLVKQVPDETIIRIVDGWAPDIEAKRARDLGFTVEDSFEEIVRAHIEDELGGSVRAPA